MKAALQEVHACLRKQSWPTLLLSAHLLHEETGQSRLVTTQQACNHAWCFPMFPIPLAWHDAVLKLSVIKCACVRLLLRTENGGEKSTTFHNISLLRVRRWRKSCTVWTRTSQPPLTPELILIICVEIFFGRANHDVVQDFRNGAHPKIFTAPDSNIKLGVEG